MKREKAGKARYRVSTGEALKLVFRHAKKRIMEQLKAVTLIIVYLILFQILVLKIPLFDASLIGVGFVLVVMGLAFFMEGLLLGLMPLGEVIGIRLPLKAGVFTILIIGFILGVGATFAEPSIGALKLAGQSLKAWNSPLLFLLLTKYSSWLVYAIGVGVGFAMVFGILRFLFGWSLKPFIFSALPVLLGLSFFAYRDPNLNQLLGLAWDCGAITTGPVTVPLILAMGIGISHVARKGGGDNGGGFGVVTLASLFPVLAVMLISFFINTKVPEPTTLDKFFQKDNIAEASYLFESVDELKGYALVNASKEQYLPLFDDSEEELTAYLDKLFADENLRHKAFGSQALFEKWLLAQEDNSLKIRYYRDEDTLNKAYQRLEAGANKIDFVSDFRRHGRSAVQAIVPLSFFLILVMFFVLREKLPRADEIFLGLFFALFGMVLFSGGIELGLGKIGDQVGANLPASFTEIELPAEKVTIRGFEEEMVNKGITAKGEEKSFFYFEKGKNFVQIPYEEKHYDREQKQYDYIPSLGPLFGDKPHSALGIFIVLLFAFFMGYGATLAEPALNALGIAVEDITVGTFKKSLLIQAVAVGVGFGIALGLVKIIWDLPLFWMLLIPYAILIVITYLSSEDYVNIGWDSAGVTTGPITVPLVLALGLGVGAQVGAAEGFGILSMASVCPIISVLSVGLFVNYRRKAALKALGGAVQAKEVKGE